MISDYEEVLETLLTENERLKRENARLMDSITSYMNKNNDLWNKFIRANRIEEARDSH